MPAPSKLITLVSRVWASPTGMTWMNLGAKVLSLGVVIPMVLRRFSPADIALYYLFFSIVALQLLAAAGFIPTFSRFVSYALAGVGLEGLEHIRLGRGEPTRGETVDPLAVSMIIGTLHRIFLVLAVGTVPIMAIVGTLLLRRPVGFSSHPSAAWVAWVSILMATPFVLYGSQFSSVLQGANRIALDQRWSAIFALAGAASSLLVLALGGGLLALVATNQIWQVLGVGRLALLCRKLLKEVPYIHAKAAYDKEIFRAIWPASWRSLVGVAMSNGVAQMSGVVFAQKLASAPLAEFLFAQRLISLLNEACRAPFYSKMPILNQLRALGKIAELRAVALKGMQLSYASFIVPFLLIPLAAPAVFRLIGSHIAFPGLVFWSALGMASFVERFGAMHIQVYSTTNDIIWHWLNGITGAVWIVLMMVLEPQFGLFAYPIAMFAAYGALYSNIAVRRSLRSIGQGFFQFEKAAFIPASAAMITGVTVMWLVSHRA